MDNHNAISNLQKMTVCAQSLLVKLENEKRKNSVSLQNIQLANQNIARIQQK